MLCLDEGEWGGVEGKEKGGERFNEPCLGEGREGSGSTYFKKISIVKFTVMMSNYTYFFKISK